MDTSPPPNGPTAARQRSSAAESPRVVAVVVTYNRVQLLQRTLRGIFSGRRVPEAVVIVDNASTDGTAQLLADLQAPVPVDVLRLPENLGGAGGFTVGIDRALARHRPDLVWVMDDDTEPTEQTLAVSLRTWCEYAEAPEQRPVFVASRVLWSDGREHPMNSMRERLWPGARRRRAAAAVGARTIRSGSFVSLLMEADAMRRTGLPMADYFIWNDDFEYSTRLARFRDALWAPESVVLHHTKRFGTTDVDPGPRFFHDVRNKLWVFTRSQSLAPWEKAAYCGATLRLWVRTFRRSARRGPLLQAGVRGLLAALRPPRPNDTVLRGSYDLRTHQLSEVLDSEAEGEPELSRSGGEFTLLMPLYHGDRPEYFTQAFASSTWEQSLPPDEVVVMIDGPLPDPLEEALDDAMTQARQQGISARVVRNPEHRGLASVLNQGLREARCGIVARADADDVSHPERFQRQVPLVQAGEVEVIGSAMNETDATGERIEALREAVTDPEALRRVSLMRNPLNHPTVVMRREAALNLGGYEEIPAAEDYGLWLRMLAAGYRIGNLPEPLVDYRAGAGAWARRGGWGALRREVELQRRLRAHELIGPVRWIGNVVIRGGYRLLPASVRVGAYRRLIGGGRIAQKGQHHA